MRKTKTRQRIFEYIKKYIVDIGYAPTVRDIVKGLGLSTTSVVQHHLNQLEKEGFIQRDPQVFRSIRLVEKAAPVDEIPLLGTIAAGEPIQVPTAETWRTEAQDMIKVPSQMIKGKGPVFALRVKGLSMIDALIDDGDVVVMTPVKVVHDGDMVAVWLKDRQEVTLKKLYREAKTIRLQPANSRMKPIIVMPENVEVQGKVIGVIRDL